MNGLPTAGLLAGSLRPAFWIWVSRFGQAEVVMPCVLLMALWMAHARAHAQVAAWFALLVLAACFTVATKLAFMGWGMGIASLDFTGISGHSMLSAATWPVLLSLATARSARNWTGLISGYGLALLVACSMLMLGAHSPIEVAAGFLVGGLASGIVLGRFPLSPAPVWLTVVLALWLVLITVRAPTSHVEEWITQLALQLSAHDQPYTRAHLCWRH